MHSQGLLTCLITLCTGLPPHAQAQDGDYAAAFAEARKQFRSLMERIDRADRDGEVYSAELMDDILQFYRNGSDNEQVRRVYCREQVLRLYRAMFYLTPAAQIEPEAPNVTNTARLARYLDPEAAVRLRGQVTELLGTAFDDLSLTQRKQLYHLAGKVLSPDDAQALEVLDDLYHRADAAPDERPVIDAAIAEIHYQPAPSKRTLQR